MTDRKVLRELADEIRDCLLLINSERMRQLSKWGMRSQDYGTWLKILVEEVGELAQAMLKSEEGGPNEAEAKLAILKEATQVAAVAAAIIQQNIFQRA